MKKGQLASLKGLNELKKMSLDAATKLELEVIIDEILHLTESIKKLEKMLIERGKTLKGYKNITSIKGIGGKGGAIMLSIIGDINKFDSPKKLASYFGIVPSVSQSGDKTKYGHITKRGSNLGRATLVQCTHIATRYSSYLKNYYNKKKATKESGIAVIATAHKLLNTIYYTLKFNRVFVDFENYEYIIDE